MGHQLISASVYNCLPWETTKRWRIIGVTAQGRTVTFTMYSHHEPVFEDMQAHYIENFGEAIDITIE